VRTALLVLDVGNTALKAVAFDAGGRVLRAARVPFGPGLSLPFPREPGVPAVAVSVSDRNLAALEGAAGGGLLLLGRDLPAAVVNRCADPGGTGLDRLCAAVAAHARARGPAVAAGLGTAITVDAADASGAFLGGAVAPGLRAAAAGLAGAAPRLPPPDLAPGPAPLPGRTTGEALRAGFLAGFAGLVDRLAADAAAAAAGGLDEESIPLYLHGGDAEALGPLLRRRHVPAPHLVAEGARILWLRAPGARGPLGAGSPGA
jgi:type III pantothenate kinase